MGENRGIQHCITVELTFLGKFDIAGEYLSVEKKVMQCPTDIRAMTDVDCLVLSVRDALSFSVLCWQTWSLWKKSKSD